MGVRKVELKEKTLDDMVPAMEATNAMNVKVGLTFVGAFAVVV